MSIFKAYIMALFAWTLQPTFCVITVCLQAMNMCILNVIEDAVGNQCTSMETCNRLSMTLCKVSYRASVRLSEHKHNAVQTLKEYQGHREKHSSKFVSCRGRCLLGHVHIFSSMITSLCETSYVVIFDVTHDVPIGFFILHWCYVGCTRKCTYWNNDIRICIKATK
jgi:hypothetical protein